MSVSSWGDDDYLMMTKFSSITLPTQNGYTLERSINKIHNNIIHFYIKETDCYVGVPTVAGEVNINVTDCGYLEVLYRTTPKHRILSSSMSHNDILSHFRAEKDYTTGKYRLYRTDLQPDNPILSTIIDDIKVTANEETGDINITPLFADHKDNKTSQDGH